jgi:CelD/BcsL family acetyltransferase involved in cellulose biosynthesis
LLSVSAGEARVELIAPLTARDGRVSFLGGTDLVDYHQFICDGSPALACLDAVLRDLSQRVDVHSVVLESVPEDSRTIDNFKHVAESAGWTVATEQEDVAPRLKLPADWETYLAGLNKKDRHELRRKLRRLERAGEVRHIDLAAPEDVESSVDDFFRLHRLSTPEKDEFMTEEREKFFRDVAVRLSHDGVTRLSFLELDGERVAASLSFVVGGVRYLYNSGYNPEHRNLAVGLLNHVLAIKSSIEEGLSWFDFMRGNESYKYHLGGIDRRILRLTATR